MRNIPAPELTRTLDRTGRWLFKWEVRRRNDVAWTNLSDIAGGDWNVGASVPIGTPDAPAYDFTVKFIRASDGRTLALGISEDDFNLDAEDTFAPLLAPRSYIRGYAANLVKTAGDETAVWRLWVEGEIEAPEYPGADVVCNCKTWDAVVERAWIEEKEERGSADEDEQPEMEDEMQALADTWPPSLPFPLTVHTPVSPDHAIGPYAPDGSLGAQFRTIAQEIGWDTRFLPDPDTGAAEFTLYEPPRDKTVPDLSLLDYHVERVPGLKEDATHVRNAFKLTGQDADGRQFTVWRVNEDSINGGPGYGHGYGRAFMGIVDPKVASEAQGDALLAFADNDLSKPLAELRVRIPFCPWINTHDLIEIPPLVGRYDFTTVWGVVGGTHEVEPGEKYTELELHGGGVVGQYLAWHARRNTPITPPSGLYEISNVRVVEASSTATEWAVTCDVGAGIEELWGAWELFTGEESAERWALVDAAVVFRSAVPPVPVLMIPKQGDRQVTLLQLEGVYYADTGERIVGDIWRKPLFGTAAPLVVDLEAAENAEGTEFTARVNVITDPRGVISGVDFYVKQPDDTETGPHAAIPAGGDWEDGPFPLPPKPHFALLRAVLHRNDDAEDERLGPIAVDADRLANVQSVTWGNEGDETTAMVIFDSDTPPGVGGARMSVDGGAWQVFDVPGDRRGISPTVARSTTAAVVVIFQAMDAAGNWGPDFPTLVSRYDPPAASAPLFSGSIGYDVEDTGTTDETETTWAVTAAVNDTDYGVQLTHYRAGSQVDASPTLIAPSLGFYAQSIAGGDGISDLHKVRAELVRIADNANADARLSPEVASAV